MLTENLYREVLLAPVERGADTLYIVSGYGMPRMAKKHLSDALESGDGRPIGVNLIVGMAPTGKIAQSAHNEFKSLTRDAPGGAFHCRYVEGMPPTHAKMYAWFRGEKPVAGHIGSANYTHQGFLTGQREVMTPESPKEILSYYRDMFPLAIDCTDPAARKLVRKDDRVVAPEIHRARKPRKGAESIVVSLLNSQGEMFKAGGGLNWGQPTINRTRKNTNEGYIPLRAVVYHSDFFPPNAPFVIHTDDGQSFRAARRAAESKEIHSIDDNSILGAYFRRRLDVVLGGTLALGGMISKKDLENYGRADVTFHKIDDDNYYMDFSVPFSRAG